MRFNQLKELNIKHILEYLSFDNISQTSLFNILINKTYIAPHHKEERKKLGDATKTIPLLEPRIHTELLSAVVIKLKFQNRIKTSRTQTKHQ